MSGQPCWHTTVAAENMIDQANRKTEFPRLHPVEVASVFMVYDVKTGCSAAATKPEAEPSSNQLSSLSTLVKSSAIPYVDLAVWPPYTNRRRNKQTFHGCHLGVRPASQSWRTHGICGSNHVGYLVARKATARRCGSLTRCMVLLSGRCSIRLKSDCAAKNFSACAAEAIASSPRSQLSVVPPDAAPVPRIFHPGSPVGVGC